MRAKCGWCISIFYCIWQILHRQYMWAWYLMQWSYQVYIFCINLTHQYINGLVQESRNSIASALELRLSCTNPLISMTSVKSFRNSAITSFSKPRDTLQPDLSISSELPVFGSTYHLWNSGVTWNYEMLSWSSGTHQQCLTKFTMKCKPDKTQCLSNRVK